MPEIGSCRCGAVTYELGGEDSPYVYACHCLHCQTWSGSAFGEHVMALEASLHCMGTLKTYSHTTDGIVFDDFVCNICNTRIYNRNNGMPGMIFLRAGTLARSHQLAPIAHIWTKRKQPWISIPDHIPSFAEAPTPEEFGQAVRLAQARRKD